MDTFCSLSGLDPLWVSDQNEEPHQASSLLIYLIFLKMLEFCMLILGCQ